MNEAGRTLPPISTDHRTRVGQQRRERTEAKIIQAALEVFAEKGPDTPNVDDFIKAAGMARGTFYNYFRTTAELLDATVDWLNEQMVRSIEQEVARLGDPALRLSMGLRLYYRNALNDTLWCSFMVRVPRIEPKILRFLARDLEEGRETGCFAFTSLVASTDLVIGSMHQSLRRLHEQPEIARKTEGEFIRLIFRGLGVSTELIDRLMLIQLPEWSSTSTAYRK